MTTVGEQMHVFFEPRSVAIIGASRDAAKAGHVIFKNFIENRRRGLFKGEAYPINPGEQSILGFPCYPSVLDVPGEVDLITVVVPARFVPRVMEDAAKKRVKAAVVISSGFREIGETILEEQVKNIAAQAGIRLLGPNCLGVFDSYTGVDMLFLPETKILSTGDEMVATPRPMPGYITVVTQSGAFGPASLDFLTGRHIGISKMISLGNKADISEPEVLSYLLEDEKTRVILLYVEGMNKGREFLEVARKVTRCKPIVALKSGRTSAGARAAASHTGALSGSDLIYDGAFRQAGVIRVRDIEEFFDAAKAFAYQPPAHGENIVILTDAGGPGVMCADELESKGVFMKPLSQEALGKMNDLKKAGKIPSFAATHNPVDLTGSATSEMFEASAKVLVEEPSVHGVIVIGIHHVPALTEDYVDRIASVANKGTKPVVACDIGETEMALYVRSRFEKLGVPCYETPEDAAKAMSALVKYGKHLRENGYYEHYVKEFKPRSA
jgi:acetyl coenzyme A synthetase (ADP forming)-like protein